METAGIEPASASPLPLALHAYSDFILTACYPPDGEDTQLVRYLFSALAPNKPPSRFYESDAGMFLRTWTHRHGTSPTAIYRCLSGECVVVVVCNYNLQKILRDFLHSRHAPQVSRPTSKPSRPQAVRLYPKCFCLCWRICGFVLLFLLYFSLQLISR